jgi:molybdate transport system substrate-binding protein
MICTRYLSRCLHASLIVASCALLALGILRAQDKAAAQAPVRIAAAADLQPAMSDLVSQYQTENAARLDVTYGSSGNSFAQIQNGAPFDLFFSADIEYPRKLQLAGAADPGTLRIYAVGQIVLWAPPGAQADIAKRQWGALLHPSVQRIAIANPAHAPYGRAAVAALRKAGVYDRVQAKLVYGENISQAAQFVQSGNAQVGILAKSLAMSSGMSGGESWDVPADMYPPIEQAAVVLKNGANKDGARAFLDFVESRQGHAILARHGFAFMTPPSAAREGTN